MKNLAKSAKAIAALVGSLATALLAIYGPDTKFGSALVVVAVVATTVGTWLVSNGA